MKKTQTQIRMSDDFAFPLEEFVTSTQAVLAKKRSGKSYAAQVQAEDLLAAGQQIVVLDPTGAWWGLRSSADGSAPGYAITIFGGDHGDVALEPTAGRDMAGAIVAEGFSAVLDLSSMMKKDRVGFAADFLESLYHANRRAVHLFIDEANAFAPQSPDTKEHARCLSATDEIVRMAGIRGIGVTLISQRSALVNKHVLSQIDQLVMLRMNHPKDIGAVRDWLVGALGDAPDVRKLIAEACASLPSLPLGTAWVWSPGGKTLVRVAVRRKRTFDSGRTPRAGEHRSAPKVLAEVDLQRLGDVIAATAKRAADSDPKVLRARVAELEKALWTSTDVMDKANKQLRARVAELERGVTEPHPTVTQVECLKRDAGNLLTAAESLLEIAKTISARSTSVASSLTARRSPPAPSDASPSPAAKLANFARNAIQDTIDAAVQEFGAGQLPPGEAAILGALAAHRNGLRPEQLTVLCGYRRTSRNTYLQRLRQRGLCRRDGELLVATPSGLSFAAVPAPPVGEALIAMHMAQLPPGEAAILGVLVNAYPRPVSRAALLPDKYKRTSRNTYLQRLRARELVVHHGDDSVLASPHLFGEAAAR